MKTRFFSRLLVIALLVAAAEASQASIISFNDMTPQARQVAQSALNSGALKRVETVDYQGHPIYALTFQTPNGGDKYLYLNPDGTYAAGLASTAMVTPAPNVGRIGPTVAPSSAPLASQTLQLGQVPVPVQRVIQTELKNGPVSKIVQLPNSAGTGSMYEVFFAKPNGKEKIIYLNPDGTYVQNGNTSRTGDMAASWKTLNSQALNNPQPMNFAQLPPAVQTSFRSEAGASAIQNIEVGQWNGQAVYQGNIIKNGQLVQMRVDPQGAILSTGPVQNTPGYVER